MSRNLDTTFAASLESGVIAPIILAMLTFKSQVCYVWSGCGTLVWNGYSFLGVGSAGKIGQIVEGVEVRADGTTLELSGIDPVYQAECLTDIQIGAPAKIWFGNFLNGAVVGQPYLIFSGTVDKPLFNIGPDAVTIQLSLENRMIDQGRATMRRYTSADQHIAYPQDTAFGWVEMLNDAAWIWGS